MTRKEFYEAVMNGIANEDTQEFAKSELIKLEAEAAKRAARSVEKAKEFNSYVAEAIGSLEAEGALTASQVAEQLGVSVQKASSVMRRAVILELATAEDVKITGKGKVKAYTIL